MTELSHSLNAGPVAAARAPAGRVCVYFRASFLHWPARGSLASCVPSNLILCNTAAQWLILRFLCSFSDTGGAQHSSAIN